MTSIDEGIKFKTNNGDLVCLGMWKHEKTVQHLWAKQTWIGLCAQAATNNHCLEAEGSRRIGTSQTRSWSRISKVTCD